MVKLFEKTELLDTAKHMTLRWQCLGKHCPTSCCYIPHRSSIILGEVLELSNYFPILFFAIEKDGHIKHDLCILFKHEHGSKCLYLQEEIGCTLVDKKPLACKQYPFQIVKDNLNRDLVMIDRTCPGFSEESGEILFPEKGTLNRYFEDSFLKPSKELTQGFKETQLFVDSLFSYNLVVGGKFVYKNVEVPINFVDENKLFALPFEVLKDFKNRGYMRYIYAHLNSLQHIRKLIDAFLQENATSQKEHSGETVFIMESK